MSSERILLVEDEEHLAFTLAFNLREDGYTVECAPDLAAARKYLAAAPVDVVVLDIMLPDGTGLDLARELRAAGRRECILMLTALGMPEDIVRGLDAGADDYVAKPFALEELFGRLRALLRRREWSRVPDDAASSEYAFGRYRVNFTTGVVSVDDAESDDRLTDLEVRLLRYLIAHANESVSRARLLEAVWELPPTASTRTVDNFVVRLRRRFEDDPRNPRHLLTVHGIGYRFVPEP